MSLEQQLRDVLSEHAERHVVPAADIHAVVAGGTTRRRRSRRRTTVAIAAAVVLATVGGIAAWSTQLENRSVGPTDRPTQDSCVARGQMPTYAEVTRGRPDFVGEPTVHPQRDVVACRVVFRKYLHNGPPGNAALTGKVWLFSDGRVISWSDATDGLVEQRLTTDGVELVLAMVVDHLSEVRIDPWASAAYCRRANAPGRECAGTVPYQGRTHWISDYADFADRLFDLSWLPDRAWVREGAEPYTPTWWVACYGGRDPFDEDIWSGDHPMLRQQVLDRLPDEATAVLVGKDTTTVPIRWRHDNGVRGTTNRFCTVVGADEQQAITGGSEEAIPLGRINDLPAELAFSPVVADGEIPCFCA